MHYQFLTRMLTNYGHLLDSGKDLLLSVLGIWVHLICSTLLMKQEVYLEPAFQKSKKVEAFPLQMDHKCVLV